MPEITLPIMQERTRRLPDLEYNHILIKQPISNVFANQVGGPAYNLVMKEICRALAEELPGRLKASVEAGIFKDIHTLEGYIFTPEQLKELLMEAYGYGLEGRQYRVSA